MLHGFQFAFKMIKKRPLRMCLTLLQVAAGVASITIVLSFVFAMMAEDQTDFKRLTVQIGEEMVMNNQTHRRISSLFTDEMIEEFKNESSYAQYMSIEYSMYQVLVQYDGMSYMTRQVLGVGVDYEKMMNLKILDGFFFTQADVDSGNKVLLISKEAKEELFGKESGVGKRIKMAREGTGQTEEWRIIGVYSREGQSNDFTGLPHFIAPYQEITYRPQTDQGEYFYEQTYSNLFVTVKSDQVAQLKEELTMIFDHKFKEEVAQQSGGDMENMGLIFNDESDYLATSRKEIGKTFGLFIGSFAFVAIVVSSIGILSMMLVSIVERTREIGLRRSLGASRSNIVGQILAESVMLSFLGGVMGIILAFIFIEPVINELILKALFQDFLNVNATVSIYPILISMTGILLVGFLAGIYPGFQASRLLPVDAIRES